MLGALANIPMSIFRCKTRPFCRVNWRCVSQRPKGSSSSKAKRILAQLAVSFISLSSKSHAARDSALFLARARRKPSQRIPDKVIDNISSQMIGAIVGVVILFIDSPSRCGTIRRRAGMGKNCSGIKTCCYGPSPSQLHFSKARATQIERQRFSCPTFSNGPTSPAGLNPRWHDA